MREAWRPTVPSAESNLLEEPDLMIDHARNFVVIMKDWKNYKNTIK